MNDKLGWDLLLLLLCDSLRAAEAPIPNVYWEAVAISIIEDDWNLDQYE